MAQKTVSGPDLIPEFKPYMAKIEAAFKQLLQRPYEKISHTGDSVQIPITPEIYKAFKAFWDTGNHLKLQAFYGKIDEFKTKSPASSALFNNRALEATCWGHEKVEGGRKTYFFRVEVERTRVISSKEAETEVNDMMEEKRSRGALSQHYLPYVRLEVAPSQLNSFLKPKYLSDMGDDLARKYPGFEFKGFLNRSSNPPELEIKWLPSSLSSMRDIQKQAKYDLDEVVPNIKSLVRQHGSRMNSFDLVFHITPAVQKELQDPANRATLLNNLSSAHPDITFGVITIDPHFFGPTRFELRISGTLNNLGGVVPTRTQP